MKKYFLAAVLVMVSASAMADRVVSGTTNCGIGEGNECPAAERVAGNKVTACESAKKNVRSQLESSEQVEAYSKCDCDQDSHGKWSCSVDARLEKKH